VYEKELLRRRCLEWKNKYIAKSVALGVFSSG
jgi:hypothetical protein